MYFENVVKTKNPIVMDNKYNLPALHKEKWVCVSIYYDDYEHLLTNVAATLSREVLDNKIASMFIHLRGGPAGEVLNLTFKISQYNLDLFLKEKIRSHFDQYFKKYSISKAKVKELPFNSSYFPLKEYNIDIEDNFMFYNLSAGGWNIFNGITAEILSCSSEIIIGFHLKYGNEWNQEQAIEKQLTFHLVLLKSFQLNVGEAVDFLDWVWDRMFNSIDLAGVPDMDDWKQVFMNGIESNFNTQKETFINYIQYLTQSLSEEVEFEEEWINSWIKTCQLVNLKAIPAIHRGDFIDGDNILPEEGIPMDQLRKWNLIETYIRSINNQLGISFIYEFNTLYAIKESLRAISQESPQQDKII